MNQFMAFCILQKYQREELVDCILAGWSLLKPKLQNIIGMPCFRDFVVCVYSHILGGELLDMNSKRRCLQVKVCKTPYFSTCTLYIFTFTLNIQILVVIHLALGEEQEQIKHLQIYNMHFLHQSFGLQNSLSMILQRKNIL